jgi:hypothetical protein
MSRVVNCPKCNEQGSLQPKKTKHGTYWRVAHYKGLVEKTRKIQWCYIGKELPEKLTSQLITHDHPKITQEEIERNKLRLTSFKANKANQPFLPVSLADTHQLCKLSRIC